MAWKAHRINDGRLVRRGAALALIAMAFFATTSWYYWQQNWSVSLGRKPSGFDLNVGILTFKSVLPPSLNFDVLGAAVIFLAGLIGTYYMVYVHTRAADFLIETEAELRKVTWPEYKPWLKADVELWGSTYVVIIVLGALSAVIFGWDFLLQAVAKIVFMQ